MKTKLTIILIMIFLINFMLVGCNQNSALIYSEVASNNNIENDLYFKDINNQSYQVNSEIFDFENRIKAFNKFNRDFLNIWSKYIYSTEPLLKSFNEEKDNLDLKVSYAKLLIEEYDKFSKELSQMEVPDIATKAYKNGFSSIVYRKLYFETYIDDINKYNFENISKLNDIENKAYLSETMFWEDLDIIYKDFEVEVKKFSFD